MQKTDSSQRSMVKNSVIMEDMRKRYNKDNSVSYDAEKGNFSNRSAKTTTKEI